MQIDHINIKAQSGLLKEVRDFYCHVLGLVEGFRPKFRSGGFWLYADGKAIIHLSESSEHHGDGMQGSFDHFAIRVDDMSAITERLDKIGLVYTTVQLSEIGLTQLFFKDPAGTGVEVNCLDKSN
jgi:catechol 2,3-dioxygenase-like lactoylglutathione lyase family enzyme